jgi:hypothetical protein
MQLGLSLDEGALLSDTMLEDPAVQVLLRQGFSMKRCFPYSTHAFCATQQAVFATFIDGDDGGKEGLEQLQTRLRRISTCSQFVAK